MTMFLRKGYIEGSYSVKLLYPATCNYNCSYCHESGPSGPVVEPREGYIQGVSDLIDTLKEPVRVGVVGSGEPALYKATEELSTLKNPNLYYLNIMSNLSQPIELYERMLSNIPVNLECSCTWHPEFSPLTEFISKLKILGDHALVYFMFLPGEVKNQLPLFNRIRNIVSRIEPNVINENGGMRTYTKEDLELLHTLPGEITTRCFYFDDDEANSGRVYSAIELYNEKMHHFKNWLCKGANKLLIVERDGTILPEERSTDFGNIFTKYTPPASVDRICSRKLCNCYAKLVLPKVKLFKKSS